MRSQRVRSPDRRLLHIVFTFLSIFIGVCSAEAQEAPRVVHVFVALADNEHQGIVPVPKALGNGDDAVRNLYWGAAFGVRTYFRKSPEWKEVAHTLNPTPYVLERSVFYDAEDKVAMIADAYRGREIKQAVHDFFEAASGNFREETLRVAAGGGNDIEVPGSPELIVYVGHDGLMDFALEQTFPNRGTAKRQAIVLACASKSFFAPGLRPTGAEPLLWTTGLMAPEAYTLKAALDGWMRGESGEQIRRRAAEAYGKYQKISVGAGMRLFASGW
jgi:hypothetical protein